MNDGLSAEQISTFRRSLMRWYRLNARRLPWRGVTDPYETWVSEIMLQQTRVNAVIAHYVEFLRRFPTLVALALAPESDVLAAWSGMGYYRRARMLHKAAQFILEEQGGLLPRTSVELRTLPGIGEYTSAAIASIAFGESIAVVDGNVERVLLRITGRPKTGTASTQEFIARQARALVPPKRVARKHAAGKEGFEGGVAVALANAAGDHNQAMMELGATICLPQAPLCLHCPVYALCRTRGEHISISRAPLRSKKAAYLLSLRKRGLVTEVLLEKRPSEASLMPGMYELPPLSLDAPGLIATPPTHEPIMRLRHAITNTNYYVEVYAIGSSRAKSPADRALLRAVIAGKQDLHWMRTRRLYELPLTGLARKTLQRLNVMAVPSLREPETIEVPSPRLKKKLTIGPYFFGDMDDAETIPERSANALDSTGAHPKKSSTQKS